MRIPLVMLNFLALVTTGCVADAASVQRTRQPAPIPTSTVQPLRSPEPTAVLPTASSVSCDDWQLWPVVPSVSPGTRLIYQRGQSSGNNTHAFSKIGDGEISAAWFFTAFDLGSEYYDLGPYQDLQPVIDHFPGSFERIGMAAKRGFNTKHILDTTVALDAPCVSGESPITCELRLHRPAFAILSLGTNQAWTPDEFESGMRQMLDILIAHDVVPILSTKGDNLEGDHRINHAIACLAVEYDLPLWNFWSAIQPLPNHGLQPDLEHLTYGIPDFSNARAMQTAWTIRNLTALQALDAVWRGAGH